LRWWQLQQLPLVRSDSGLLSDGSEVGLNSKTLRIGTRGSLLALRQSHWVRDVLIQQWPGLNVELQIIKTTGDIILDVPLAKVGGKGLFVKEIEEALSAADVDLAVHSMKDVPAVLPEGLMIAAIPLREDPRDVLVTHAARSLAEIAPKAKVGTSSLRRSAQLKVLRPDLVVENLRGNLDTRLRKVEDGHYDAIILAAAGLHRMGWQHRISQYLDADQFVPAVGQGAIGIEARAADREVLRYLVPLHHAVTAVAVTAERSFLKELEGGCQVPIAGHARVRGDEVEFTGLVASVNGDQVLRHSARAAVTDAQGLGWRVARELLAAGARRILDETYHNVPRAGHPRADARFFP
jgi:hydroxymethylbilane synthase